MLRIAYLLVVLLTNALIAQTTVDLPDTIAYRGKQITIPVRIDHGTLQSDTITVEFEFSQAQLHIEQFIARFPEKLRVLQSTVHTTPGAEFGRATVEMVATSSVPIIELEIICTVLWSGPSPAFLTASTLEINGRPMRLATDRSVITLFPAQPLTIEGQTALGPLRPQPLYEPSLEVTYWLGEGGETEFVLFDPLGRELGRWSTSSQSAGTQTIVLPLDRMATSAGVYYLRMQVGPQIRITPCVIGK